MLKSNSVTVSILTFPRHNFPPPLAFGLLCLLAYALQCTFRESVYMHRNFISSENNENSLSACGKKACCHICILSKDTNASGMPFGIRKQDL